MDTIKEKLFIFMQKIMPSKLISKVAFYISTCRVPFIKNSLIDLFIKYYDVDLSISVIKDIDDFDCFHDFFIREIELDQRPLPRKLDTICSPAEGVINNIGLIDNGSIIQAKDHNYDVKNLLGGDRVLSNNFNQGNFVTIYLAPRDYHRIHMPMDGTLKKMIYIPGKLFSVNKIAAQNIPNLFANNERVIFLFDTEIGEIALIMVGSMIVGSIYTSWSGTVNPQTGDIHSWDYSGHKINFKKGEEIGYFHMGSTAILLTPPNKCNWDKSLDEDSKVELRQSIGDIIRVVSS